MISYFFSIIFLINFIFDLIFFDILFRIFGKLNYELFYRTLNYKMIFNMKLTGVKFDADLKHKIVSNKCLIISNHQSLMDIPVLVYFLKELKLRFISKIELSKKLPFVSVALRSGSHILIDRNKVANAKEQIRVKSKELFFNDTSLVIFPEGTRSRDGVLKKFKMGGIYSVLEENPDIEIIGVIIDNSYKFAENKLFPVPFGIKMKIKSFNISKDQIKNLNQIFLDNIT